VILFIWGNELVKDFLTSQPVELPQSVVEGTGIDMGDMLCAGVADFCFYTTALQMQCDSISFSQICRPPIDMVVIWCK
jgi:hypothetical protein